MIKEDILMESESAARMKRYLESLTPEQLQRLREIILKGEKK